MMGARKQRTYFPAATSVVVILALFGAGVLLLRPHIPAPPPNALVDVDGDYSKAGSRQAIKWYPLGRDAFNEAVRTGKLLFCAIGAQWSAAARQADATSFLNPDVVERLRQGYVCVRIDVDQNPEWLNAYFPVARNMIGDVPSRQLWFEPSFQVIVLDPKELVVSWLLRRSPSERMEPPFFIGGLAETQDRVQAFLGGQSDAPKPGAIQAQDAAPLLNTNPPVLPDLNTHVDWIRGHIDKRYGGQPVNGFQLLRPSQWRFLLMSGSIEELRQSLDPCLRSGIVDWIDGGFFRIASTPSWQGIEFDKLAVQNAEMMSLLAACWSKTRDPLFRVIALRTFDCLIGPFSKNGLVRGFRAIDRSSTGRSPRNSFSAETLRNNFDPDQREWLRKNLGLRVETNPQMSPLVSDPRRFLANEAEFESMLRKLSELHAEARETYGSEGLLDVNGYVCARLLETSRIIGDQKRMAEAAELYDRLSAFRVGVDDVIHGMLGRARAYRYLGDYLAYADASMEHYRTFGFEDRLKDGEAVLRRALFLFGDQANGIVLNGTMDGISPKPPNASVPEIADNVRESTLAMVARLSWEYGVVQRKPDLIKISAAVVGQYGALVNGLQNGVSGLFCSTWLALHARALVSFGGGSLSTARSANRKDPFALSFVAPRDAWKSSAPKADGMYLFTNRGLTGPIQQDEVERLGANP